VQLFCVIVIVVLFFEEFMIIVIEEPVIWYHIELEVIGRCRLGLNGCV